MQHLENDMDDLFQRAADNYPLKSEKGDWESVARRLAANADKDKEGAPATLEKKSRKKIFFLVALLALLISAGLYHQFMGVGETGVVVKTVHTKASNGSRYRNDNKTRDITSVNNKPTLPATENVRKGKNTTDSTNTGLTSIRAISVYASRYAGKTGGILRRNPESTIVYDNSNHHEQQPEDNIITEASGNDDRKTYNNDISNPLKKESEEPGPQKKEKDTMRTDKRSTHKANVTQRKGLYAGAVAGLDFSKVESTSFANTGFNAGFLAGYRINNFLSLETGLIWNKKYYNSDGKYFRMDKIRSSMPSGMVIDNLESQSSLIEIPVKAKFDFSRKSNSNLFATGGVSSYIMTMEKNMYNATVNGTQEKVAGVYKKNNYGFPSVINVSLGYEHNISRVLNIRVEPFLKIPLQGIGVGNLRVTSAGLQIGITGRLK